MRLLARLVVGLVKLALLTVVVAGIAVGAVVGWDMWQRAQETDSDAGLARINYNGALPGCGNPWLTQVMAGPYSERSCPEFQERFGPTVGDCSEEFPLPGWFWVLGSPDMDQLYVPVPIDEKGFARSWADVYELACRHPQLGGTGLTAMAEAEVEALGHWGDAWYRSEGPAPNGGTNKYLLHTLTAETLDLMTIEGESGMCGPASRPVATEATTTTSATTTTKPETQRWQVAISGYEIDLMERYWRITTQVRAAIRFDYTMQAEFSLRKEDGEWVFDSGTVTYAEIALTPEYWPQEAWEIEWPVNCTNCDITYPRSLTGQVTGDAVKLRWGTFRPTLKVHAKIIAPCLPMPGCAEWKNRIFKSTDFFERINGQRLNLTEGAVLAPPIVDSASGLQWLDYTITLRGSQG